MPNNNDTNTERAAVAKDDLLASLIRDAKRYRAIKEKIEYSDPGDGMAWATMEWCIDVYSLSPSNLDDAIDEILLANGKDHS
jgi:hypothetical protein